MESYVATVVDRVAEVLPDLEPELVRLYALLVLVKGPAVSLEDVHDAWAVWCSVGQPDHRSLIPFADLDPGVQELDRPYRDALVRVAAARVNGRPPVSRPPVF